MKTTFITGIAGQEGAHLAKLPLEKEHTGQGSVGASWDLLPLHNANAGGMWRMHRQDEAVGEVPIPGLTTTVRDVFTPVADTPDKLGWQPQVALRDLAATMAKADFDARAR